MSAESAAAGPGDTPLRLSQEIDALLAEVTEHPIRLRDLIAVLKGRAYTLLLILISLPFCLPIPLPGVSMLFGVIIAVVGVRLSLRMHPWLPARLLDAQLSGKRLRGILKASRRLAASLEVFLRPRWSWLVESPPLCHLSGALICICGLLLVLPLPVPFSNGLPALVVVFLSAATLERDGVFVVVGFVAFAITVVFFGGLFLGGAAAVQAVLDWFSGLPPAD